MSADPLLAIGSYAPAGQDGIHLVRLDRRTGALTRVGGAGGVLNPSFIAPHRDGRHLYTVAEIESGPKRGSGAVAAFSFDAKTLKLALLGEKPSGSAGACHVSVHDDGKHVLVANYGGGSIAALPVGKDGKLGAASAHLAHRGSGQHPQRQAGPHAHQILSDPTGKFVVVCDLGLDQVLVYKLAKTGKLAAHGHTDIPPGSGPRHLAFHPDGHLAFVANELGSTVSVLAYESEPGAFRLIGSIGTLPTGTLAAENYPADVRVSPDGRFLYVSNRGHDSIAIFAIDADTGALAARGHHRCGGRWPRAMSFDASGEFLIVANQESDALATHRVDRATGALTSTGERLSLPKPTCVAPL